MSRRRYKLVGTGALALVLCIVILHLLDVVVADGSTVALLVIAIVLGVILWMPDVVADILSRVEKIRFGKFEIAIRETERAARVSEHLPSGDPGEAATGSEQNTPPGVPMPPRIDEVRVKPRVVTGNVDIDLLHVEAVVRKRLRFIRAALLTLDPDYDPRSVLEELRQQHLVNDDETIVLLHVLNWDIAAWPDEQRDRFLDAAWPLATRLAPHVWDRQVRQALSKAGWVISDFEQKPDHRADFLAFRHNESMIAAARVGDTRKGLEPARRRLSGEAPIEVGRRVVIIPDGADKPDDSQWPSVGIVRLSELV